MLRLVRAPVGDEPRLDRHLVQPCKLVLRARGGAPQRVVRGLQRVVLRAVVLRERLQRAALLAQVARRAPQRVELRELLALPAGGEREAVRQQRDLLRERAVVRVQLPVVAARAREVLAQPGVVAQLAEAAVRDVREDLDGLGPEVASESGNRQSAFARVQTGTHEGGVGAGGCCWRPFGFIELEEDAIACHHPCAKSTGDGEAHWASGAPPGAGPTRRRGRAESCINRIAGAHRIFAVTFLSASANSTWQQPVFCRLRIAARPSPA